MKTKITQLFLVMLTIGLVSCSDNKDLKMIVNTIDKVCDCEEVVVDMQSVGLTFSKDSPNSTGKRYEIRLKDCEVENLEGTMIAISEKLDKEGLCQDLFIELDFDKQAKSYVIKDCSIALIE
jgi:hypothetical protein